MQKDLKERKESNTAEDASAMVHGVPPNWKYPA